MLKMVLHFSIVNHLNLCYLVGFYSDSFFLFEHKKCYKRIKIEKSHLLFLTYYILISFSLIISGIISLILKNPYLIIGSGIIALPLILLMIYQIYVMEDKVIVYKNPQIIKKELNKESIKEPESS